MTLYWTTKGSQANMSGVFIRRGTSKQRTVGEDAQKKVEGGIGVPPFIGSVPKNPYLKAIVYIVYCGVLYLKPLYT